MARQPSSLAEQVALGAMAAAAATAAASTGSAPAAATSSRSTNGGDAADPESPARLVRLSSALIDTNESGAAGDSTSTASITTTHDPSLPTGWQKVTHDSGLPCYVHEQQRLVCWSKPYVLDLMCSPGEFVKVTQQHVPPLSLFKTAGDSVSKGAKEKSNGSAQETTERSNGSSKKRKLKSADQERPPPPPKTQESPKQQSSEPMMSMEEFKTLLIRDSRVLQACMELTYKTPAQVLQEYQNRNRGISVNYNTHSIDQDGAKYFKTIVSAGSSVAEGTATTKKVAKQLSAQSLLALLHERTVKTYYAVAELYSSVAKGQTVVSETSSAPPTISESAYRRPVDPRLSRSAASGASNGGNGNGAAMGGRGKKRDRRYGPGGYNGGGAAGCPDYSDDVVGDYVQTAAAAAGYPRYGDPNQTQQHWGGYGAYYNSSSSWQQAPREPENDAYASASEQGSERERIVEFSKAAPASAPAPGGSVHGYGGQYCGAESSWGYNGGNGSTQYGPMAQGYPAPPPPQGYGPPGQYGPPPPQRGDASSRGYYAQQQQTPPERSGGVYGRLKVNLRSREP